MGRLLTQRSVAVGLATTAYVVAVLGLVPVVGVGILVLSAVLVVLTGMLFGLRVALIYTLALIAFNVLVAAPYWPAADPSIASWRAFGPVGLLTIAAAVGFLRDVAERLRRSEVRLRTVVDASLDAIIGMDVDGRIFEWNPQAAEMFGWSRADALGLTVAETIVPPILRRSHLQGLERYRRTGEGRIFGQRIQLQAAHRSGRVFPVELAVTEVRTGGGSFIASIRDLTELVTQRERLEHLAVHDELTDLPNRIVLRDRIELAAEGAARDGVAYGLLMVNLSQFTRVNADHGREVGDLVLRTVAERLQSLAGPTDTVARMGGDRFAMLLGRPVDPAALAELAAAIRTALETGIAVGGTQIRLAGTVGGALGPEHGRDPETLVRSAETAMLAAREGRPRFAMFDPGRELETSDRRELTADLRRALDAQELWLAYQPIIDIAQGRCRAVEALCRWDHPERGSIPPSEFIPLAEAAGLIGPLELWVLDEAIAQCARWEKEGFPLGVAVNIAPAHLDQGGIAHAIAAAIRSSSLPPQRVTLEITETSLGIDVGTTLRATEAIRDLGIRVAIDDFGTGYSSFSFLQHLIVDQLKIDRSFVAAATSDEQSAAIVRTTVDLAHRLGARVVGEGIERPETLEMLRAAGCDEGQGYLFSPALPPAELITWLKARSPERPAGARSGTGPRSHR